MSDDNTQDAQEPSPASAGSTPWADAMGSKAERLHDLGMVVGYVCSVKSNLNEAIYLAEALNLVDAPSLATMKGALSLLDGLRLGEHSKVRVVEVYKECCNRS
jgi:hypothetical protein